MKILLVTRGYPSEKHPQIGNFEATQAQALAKFGHEVIVVGLNCYSIKNYDILGSHERKDGNIFVYEDYLLAIPTHNLMPIQLMSKLLTFRLNRIFRRVVDEHGIPDVIHSHYLLMTSAAVSISNKYNIPIVCTEHWSRINSEKIPSSIINIGQKSYRLVDKIIAVSKQTAKSIRDKFGFEAQVVYNMVDDSFFEKCDLNKLNPDFTFICIGEMSDNRKGFDILIRAFSKYLKSGFKGKLVLIGHGRLESDYRNLVKDERIDDNVLFVGEMHRPELRTQIASSDVVVMSSRIETFGVVLIEGMAQGKPVVATRCGGPEEFVTPDCGLLVDVEDVDGLCDAMIKMKNNYSKYDSHCIIRNCRENYSQSHIANKLIQIYADLTQK
ncbi:MAG: glycosyltransferase family 4 protein [Muribaculum sp.]|nr:glycosyltransferase family 4 protein [Muribaculum sp.]